ncbi:methylated-DNA--[protein]-cysteine S-methyltransferase [Brevibacillus fulvus]|uniref:Methylated-DNA--protein-cysteine methyltransferase n=1 Tax=Brevibacillus fulvus TaxID=1125967 RepID=A0A938Y2C9_9BACL|nr:methylated-DNA--[protein]-cysteine S-methyltransferase [Brevibacillus fulvus]MBM7591119.1 methylated-DNA-[protein]-cysteine S-methyltransferase [Brevibacillus fulvus]
MNAFYQLDYLSPIGTINVCGTREAVWSVAFSERPASGLAGQSDVPQVLRDCVTELEEYFPGRRQTFTVPLAVEGTAFQREVWQLLQTIPYGATSSYKEVAALLGSSRAIRAVGRANGRNRLALLIPCHRVIGADGSLTGYAGGLWRKEWLLQHEQKWQQSINSFDRC